MPLPKSSFTLILAFVIPCVVLAQIPTFQFTHTPPLLDGIVDTIWESQPAVPIANNNQGTIDSDDDLNGQFKFLWDTVNLYLLVEVNDDVINSQDHASTWQDDGLEIYLDMGNEKADTYDDNDFLISLRYNDPFAHGDDEGISFAQTNMATSLIYEVKLPWSVLGFDNTENDAVFGLDIQLNDNDGDGRDGKLAWHATNDNAWRFPYLFGEGRLTGKPTLGPSATPSFSHKRGFYTDPFTLTIEASTPNTHIYYTLDGSDPRTSNTSILSSNPASVIIDPTNTENRGGLTPGVIVRASALILDHEKSAVITHSYLFTNEIINQVDPGGFWPDAGPSEGSFFFGSQAMDYEMDPEIINHPSYVNLIDDALLQLPSLSIVSDNDHLFGEENGIYMNALQQGWERHGSVELIYPDNSEGFQKNGGIRIRGGYSRIPSNPKHSFRIFFDKDHDGKLEYELFDQEGVDEFNKIDLRTAQNYSWSYDGSSQTNFVKDVSFRDIQGKMGQPYTRSRYYHLYVDGMYWGLFMTEERPEAEYAEDYFGGDENDYDVVKPDRNISSSADDLLISTTDGNDAAARRLWNKAVQGFETDTAYFEVQGLNIDGTRNLTYERLLDIDNLIDYLLIAYYSGGYDAPVSAWTSNPLRPNNFFTIYNREKPDGFKWFVHDFEHTMNRQWDHSTTDGVYEDWLITRDLGDFGTDFEVFNPVYIHLKLMENTEYQLRFADRVAQHFFEGGVFQPDSVQAVFDNRSAQIDLAIIAESARWGDGDNEDAPGTKQDWLDHLQILKNDYIPYRTSVVLNQFKDIGWYPDLNSPLLIKDKAPILNASVTCLLSDYITIRNPNDSGVIYYTNDGSDPRAIGGAISPTAILSTDSAQIPTTTSFVLKSRVWTGTEWSALKELLVNINDPITDLRITEVHYNPIDYNGLSGSYYEFIEFKNTGNTSINLTGSSLTNGITYTFPSKTLAPGDFIVLASSSLHFNTLHGFAPDGQYSGGLKNSGEKITLVNATGTEVISFTYDDSSPWPIPADGLGNSLVPTIHNPTENPNKAIYWKSSSFIHGSPGTDDPEIESPTIVISEILSHSDAPFVDAVELYNYGTEAVDISNWLLTDDKNKPTQWQIPEGSVVEANSYFTIYEAHYTGEILSYADNEFGSTFSINSHGEAIYLIQANADSNALGFSVGVEFEEIETNISFGRHITSTDDAHFVAQSEITLNEANSYPIVGPIVFNRIMYNPPANKFEFVELLNITDSTVAMFANDNPINTWHIGGIGFSFPPQVTMSANESVYIIQQGVDPIIFRAMNGLPPSVQVFNMPGTLSNDGELLSLYRPGDEYIENLVLTHKNILVEAVRYNDKAPWPEDADGLGMPLVRIEPFDYGNDVINWNNGINIPPILTSDTSNNYVSTTIELEFSADIKWTNAIESIEINGLSIAPTNYIIHDTKIEFDATVFEEVGEYTINISATSYEEASLIQFIIDNAVGNSSNSTSTISLSPNPSNGIVKITLPNEIENAYFNVFNLHGQTIVSRAMNSNNAVIDISEFQAGMYILCIYDRDKQYNARLIKE